MGDRIEKETIDMKIIIETKEELEQYEDYNSHEEKNVNSIFYDNEVVIDGNLVAGEGECQKYSTGSPASDEMNP